MRYWGGVANDARKVSTRRAAICISVWREMRFSRRHRVRGELGMLIGARMVGQDLPERIVAKTLVVVEVFVPSGDAEDALGQQCGLGQCGLGMDGECGMMRIGNDLVESVNETEIAVGFSKKKRAGIGGDVAAGKVGVNVCANSFHYQIISLRTTSTSQFGMKYPG